MDPQKELLQRICFGLDHSREGSPNVVELDMTKLDDSCAASLIVDGNQFCTAVKSTDHEARTSCLQKALAMERSKILGAHCPTCARSWHHLPDSVSIADVDACGARFSLARPYWNRLKSIDKNIKDSYGWLSRLGVAQFVYLSCDHFNSEPFLIQHSCQILVNQSQPEVAARIAHQQDGPVANEFGPCLSEAMTLPLSEDAVVWICDETTLRQAWAALKSETIIAVDSESGWVGDVNRAVLLQVAHWSQCYLIDLISFDGSTVVLDMLRDIFSADIIKLGFAFDSDLKLLGISNSSLCYFVDLQSLWQPSKKLSLRDLVRSLLQQSMCKAEQCSNWCRRPLRKSQLHYAALDAWCLLPLSDALMRERDIDLRSVCAERDGLIQQHAAMQKEAQKKQEARRVAQTEQFVEGLLQRLRRSMEQRSAVIDNADGLQLTCESMSQDFVAKLILNGSVLQESRQQTQAGARVSCLQRQIAVEREMALAPEEATIVSDFQVTCLSGKLSAVHSCQELAWKVEETHSGFSSSLEIEGVRSDATGQSPGEAKLRCLEKQLARDRDRQVQSDRYTFVVSSGDVPLRFSCRGGYVVVKGHDPHLKAYPEGVARGDVLLFIGTACVPDASDLVAVTRMISNCPRPLHMTFGRMHPELKLP